VYFTVTAQEFLRRFLQHVLPKGFVKVRYYGLFSPSWRHHWPLIRLMLGMAVGQPGEIDEAQPHLAPVETDPRVLCPRCGQAMRWVKRLRPSAPCPP
jgi:hypothetical protein